MPMAGLAAPPSISRSAKTGAAVAASGLCVGTMMNAASPPRRYLSLWLRRLATDRITRARAPAENTPLVVVEEIKSALRLAAVNDAAARLGLKPGMTLADARAMYPTIAVVKADPEADRNLLEAIADWCDRYTPLVGLDPPDGLMFDITGCAHLFGGEAALCRDIVQRLATQGLRARVAVADTVGCAWAVARYAEYLPPSESAVSNVICGGATAFPPPLRGRDREGGTSGFNLRGHPSPHPSPSPKSDISD